MTRFQIVYRAAIVALHINARGYKRIAEIGVFKGSFFKSLMLACPGITEYVGIDTWKDLKTMDSKCTCTPMMDFDDQIWTELYLKVLGKLKPGWSLIRADGDEAATVFPDGYFDLVFIDAEHFYEPLKKNIQTWLPKVRQGGTISGHDYTDKRHLGVKQAVDEVFGDRVNQHSGACWIVDI